MNYNELFVGRKAMGIIMKKLFISIVAITLLSLLFVGCAKNPLDYVKNPNFLNTSSSEATSSEAQESDKADNSESDASESDLNSYSYSRPSSNDKYDLDTFEIRVSDISSKVNTVIPDSLYDKQLVQVAELETEIGSIDRDLESCADNVYADYKKGLLSYTEYQNTTDSITDMQTTLNELKQVIDFKFDVSLP